MIQMSELLSGHQWADQTPDVQANLECLIKAVNCIRVAYNKPMQVTSGLRTRADQLRIYAAKGITDASKIPFRSQHLVGGACDIADQYGKLKEWLKAHIDVLETVGLYCEAFESTPTWVHMQIKPPASGKRFFKP